MDKQVTEYMPRMLTGSELDEALRIAPAYDESIRNASEAERLIALQDLYRIYVPTEMSREVYAKLYLALIRSMNKKQSLTAIRQFTENQNRIKGKDFSSIIGGSDSFTIIGDSGIGKSATVSRVIDLVSVRPVVELPHDMHIIPCVQVQTPADCSVKGLLFEILRKVDEILGTNYHFNAVRSRSTADMLIGSVSTVALNHIGLLVVDEIQNVVNSKNGPTIVGMLTQLINNAGVSICMVGTPKSALFFGQEMMLARRSLGLSYGPFSYDEAFRIFCCELYRYQYVHHRTECDERVLNWLYHHSGGNASVVVSLLHDAQELSILDGYERLDTVSLDRAYQSRLALLHDYLHQEPMKARKPSSQREKHPASEAKPCGSQTLITDAVGRAKRLQKNLVGELLLAGINVMEVAL